MARQYYYNGRLMASDTMDIFGKLPTPYIKNVFVPKDPTQPHSVRVPSEGVKADTGKPSYDLVPYDALEEIVKVLNFGAAKYEARNWEKGMAWGRLISSCFRHLAAFCRGEDRDPESGLSHIAHAGCNVLFLLAFQLRGVGKDDRTGKA